MWHVSSRSGVATLRTAIHLLLTCLLTPVQFTRFENMWPQLLRRQCHRQPAGSRLGHSYIYRVAQES